MVAYVVRRLLLAVLLTAADVLVVPATQLNGLDR